MLASQSRADAESLEDVTQHVFARAAADDLVEPNPRSLEIDQQEFFGDVLGRGSVARGLEGCATRVEKCDMPRIGNRRLISQGLLADKRARDHPAQCVEAIAGQRAHGNNAAFADPKAPRRTFMIAFIETCRAVALVQDDDSI